ncbi:MAG: hypothetical protein CMC04_01510 [Flavobacteriaceae bacterium]|nr:hypothetical protein [Flavobacteriaceae bacterium]
MKTSNIIFFIISFICLNSCNIEKRNNKIFFAGQIINPSSNYLLLYKNNATIDCLVLDSNNMFKRTYNNLESGIYKIEHIPEYQTIFLEPGDSLWLRVNGTDFKKSVVFSGKGSSKNNFLIDMEINLEKENNFLSSKYSLKSKYFSKIIDSLVIEKKNKWISMDSINNLSQFAQKVTMASYVYPYGTIRERYALLRGSNWSSLEDSTYFNYRKFFNYEETDLAFFDPYIDYVLNFLNEKSLDSSSYYFINKQKTEFNIKRLQVLENNIFGRELKNNLARAIAYDEILNYNNHSDHEDFLQYYFAINSNTIFLAEVLSLHNDIKKMNPGELLPKIKIQNSKLDTISSNKILNGQKTVFYFWSQSQMNHFRETTNIINKIKLEKPNYRYVGISIQPLNEITLKVIKILQQDVNNQFAIIDFENASKKWIITYLNKAIIVNADGKIVNGFGNIYSPDFLNQL